ncbi:7729_t:CDS:2 [Cetraspora pellucida]|uniref:7729_t:CDS:1 n=1 Tax=Cetraspora pellucida TaxID=1433469 RepID=A0A9N9BQR5_9GLOM|nr:7729_t:CDS:2 [Cetraspora pellucida]
MMERSKFKTAEPKEKKKCSKKEKKIYVTSNDNSRIFGEFADIHKEFTDI